MYRVSLARLVRTTSALQGWSFRNLLLPRVCSSSVLLPASPSSVSPKRYFHNNSAHWDNNLFTQTSNNAGHLEEAALREVMAAMTTVPGLLETYKNFQNTAPMVQRNRVAVLYQLTKVVQKDQQQRAFLNSDKSQEGEGSLFLNLLDQISKNISESREKDLADVMWSLGKLGVGPGKERVLVNTCVEEILSRDMTAFDAGTINQILTGLAALNLKKSQLWRKVENSMLSGEIQISDFRNDESVGSLWAFSKSGNGSSKLFELYREDIYLRDMSSFKDDELSQLIFSFAKKGVEAVKLYSHTEQEVMRKGLKNFCDMKVFLVLWAFANCKSDRSFQQLFHQFDRELVSHGVQGFQNSDLSNLVWCFSKVGVHNAKVYDIVKDEILVRGLDNFHKYLLQILWSFAVAKKKSYFDFNEKAALEFLSIDIQNVRRKVLCEYAWCFGRIRITNDKVFQAIEGEFLRRKESHWKYMHIKQLLTGFANTKTGSRAIWEFLEAATLKLDFSTLKTKEISSILWPFAVMKYKTPELYNAAEKEILARNESKFVLNELQKIKNAIC